MSSAGPRKPPRPDVQAWLNDAGGRSTPERYGLASAGWREDDSPLHL